MKARNQNVIVQKHLHGRGEDDLFPVNCDAVCETPPRTWRRPYLKHDGTQSTRNTSTDVEKTEDEEEADEDFEKHLHGRGEDSDGGNACWWRRETPPRTWRRPRRVKNCMLCVRNTSTDVEKTSSHNVDKSTSQKHLHGRGEDFNTTGIPSSVVRNTSTDVEKTQHPQKTLLA